MLKVVRTANVNDQPVQLDAFARERTGRALLLPRMIEMRLSNRRAFQVKKFRTNCSDCVPNL